MRRPRRKPSPTPMRKGHVPANAAPIELTIESVGGHGDGVGHAPVKIGWEERERPIYVPFTLPGERVRVQPEADLGTGVAAQPVELIDISADRIDPVCPHFISCGGCALQHWADTPYATWKVDLIRHHLHRVKIEITPEPLVRSAPGSRRRTDLAARRLKGRTVFGFHQRGAVLIEDIHTCPVLDPILEARIPAFRAALNDQLGEGASAEVRLNLLDTGIDALLVLPVEPDRAGREAWAAFAEEQDLARLSFRLLREADGMAEPLAARRDAVIHLGGVAVTPPPGGFLQATTAGETAIQQVVLDAAEGTRRRLDLFAGIGTLALPMVAGGPVLAIDGDPSSVTALRAAANAAGLGDRLRTEIRDLFERPLEGEELVGIDVAVFDPPRAGAKAQVEALAASPVPVVVGVSCNPATFARDARRLIDGGYRLDRLVPIDQFLWSPHIELAAVFRR
ncbi:MAG: class I SAM-dependent RNA methyltransferase [Alphaproteobacteria bacterium]|nr:class I SAM-dependent RNA methyltransferase [Alphaproteobacteria bacterium]